MVLGNDALRNEREHHIVNTERGTSSQDVMIFLFPPPSFPSQDVCSVWMTLLQLYGNRIGHSILLSINLMIVALCCGLCV